MKENNYQMFLSAQRAGSVLIRSRLMFSKKAEKTVLRIGPWAATLTFPVPLQRQSWARSTLWKKCPHIYIPKSDIAKFLHNALPHSC